MTMVEELKQKRDKIRSELEKELDSEFDNLEVFKLLSDVVDYLVSVEEKNKKILNKIKEAELIKK